MELFYEGTLTSRANGINETVQIKKLNKDQLPQILQVQRVVLEQLKVKESLQPLSEDEFDLLFNGQGLIIGVFIQSQLIAFRAVLFPGDDAENLGRDLDLSKVEQMKVVHQEISCVLPEYRGNGLQKKLAALIMEELTLSHGEYRHLCCTVFPTNYPSLKDKFVQGLVIAKVKEKYNGMTRYILYKNLHHQVEIDYRTIIEVPSSDVEQQKRLLEKGYYGFELKEKNADMMVQFGKLF